MSLPRDIFLTGATGYLGRRLVPRLLAHGHRVTALVRAGSEHRLPTDIRIIIADPFQADSFQDQVPSSGVYIQLLGVRKPSPRKADAFQSVDLPSVRASATAAAQAGVERFIYLSVAQEPTRIMADYQRVRAAGEAYCLEKGLCCVFLRPWYVLGPGHWWPVLLLPFYALAGLFPPLRRKAQALGLNTLPQLLRALVSAVEMPLEKNVVLEVRDLQGY